jgi:hypothetical protein
MPRTNSRGGGRIRVTDDTAAPVGAEVQVRAEHVTAVNATKTKESSDETRRGHRRRLKKLMEWWMTEYPDYFEAGTRILSAEEKADPMKFFHTCDRDIVYEGLRVDMVLSYMAATKKKDAQGEGQKIYSYTHMRKINDAILFGARTVKEILSSSYYSEMDSFLTSFKKETADARSHGNMDEKSADPISFSLFRLILTWAIERGNIFVWVWTILQWNLMARSISIDPLALHNISISEDHFVIRHDSTKSDKEGEKTHNKAVYCNPLDPVLCPGLSLGIWLSLNQNTFRDNSERLFLRTGSRIGSAAHRYCEQLHIIMKAHWDIVQTYITTMSAHGIRKGSATHVSCATTMPPPVASIAARGDWSIGKVLDVYWKFAEVGDNYLGRCLCGLDPDSSTFSVLPPHWTVDNPVEDTDIQEALQLMYSVIIAKHPSSIAVLVRVLASVVYAADWLLATSARHQGHPFAAVPLLQNPELLLRLKSKVSIEPTVSMLNATGVPPHVKQLTLMKNLLDLCQTTLEKVTEHATVVRQTIFDAMEERAIENGQISRHQIISILDEFRSSIKDDAREQLEAIRQSQTGMLPLFNGGGAGGGGAGIVVHGGNRGTLFSFGGRFWDVPATFAFPAGVKRDVGWKLWLQGMPGFTAEGENGIIERRNIKPFRKFLPARLPKKIADVYKIHWRPVFAMMEAGIGDIPQNLTPDIVNELYERGTDYLKTRVSYVFSNDKLHHDDWVVATWAKYLSRSIILKKGTDDDIRNLPAMKLSNRPRPIGLKRRNGAAMAVAEIAGPQQRRRRRRGPHTADLLDESDDSSE